MVLLMIAGAKLLMIAGAARRLARGGGFQVNHKRSAFQIGGQHLVEESVEEWYQICGAVVLYDPQGFNA
jgi:hypothetical protein